MSKRSNGSSLWDIRWSDRREDRALFVGTRAEMVAEINRRHEQTGIVHAAREITDGGSR